MERPGITPPEPPPDLVATWAAFEHDPAAIARRAIAWATPLAADQQLEACEKWLSGCGCESYGRELRAAMRPKPLTLAERALRAAEVELQPDGRNGSVIIAALQRLAELEAQQ